MALNPLSHKLPPDETVAAYAGRMPRRQASPPKDFAFDFTADWSPYASIVPGSDSAYGWTLHGTVTRHGHTYSMAYKDGMYAACTLCGSIQSLSAIERSRISIAVEFKQVPGLENAPAKRMDAPLGLTGPSSTKALVGYAAPVREPGGACDACCAPCYVWKQVGSACENCGKGVYQPAHFWRFVRWPDGGMTATPADWVGERDVEALHLRNTIRHAS